MPPPKSGSTRRGAITSGAAHNLLKFTIRAAPLPKAIFDFLRDNLGTQRQTFPHSAYFVAGTQADVAKNNEVMVMKASSMHRTSRDDDKFLSQQRRACDDVWRHLSKSFCLCRQHTRYLSYAV